MIETTSWSQRDHFAEFDRAMDDLDQTLDSLRETAPQVLNALSPILSMPYATLLAEQRDRLQAAIAPMSLLIEQLGAAFSKWENGQEPAA